MNKYITSTGKKIAYFTLVIFSLVSSFQSCSNETGSKDSPSVVKDTESNEPANLSPDSMEYEKSPDSSALLKEDTPHLKFKRQIIMDMLGDPRFAKFKFVPARALDCRDNDLKLYACALDDDDNIIRSFLFNRGNAQDPIERLLTLPGWILTREKLDTFIAHYGVMQGQTKVLPPGDYKLRLVTLPTPPQYIKKKFLKSYTNYQLTIDGSPAELLLNPSPPG